MKEISGMSARRLELSRSHPLLLRSEDLSTGEQNLREGYFALSITGGISPLTGMILNLKDLDSALESWKALRTHDKALSLEDFLGQSWLFFQQIFKAPSIHPSKLSPQSQTSPSNCDGLQLIQVEWKDSEGRWICQGNENQKSLLPPSSSSSTSTSTSDFTFTSQFFCEEQLEEQLEVSESLKHSVFPQSKKFQWILFQEEWLGKKPQSHSPLTRKDREQFATMFHLSQTSSSENEKSKSENERANAEREKNLEKFFLRFSGPEQSLQKMGIRSPRNQRWDFLWMNFRPKE